MKFNKINIIVLAILLLVSTNNTFAQKAPDSKPDAELTKKEAELRILDFQEIVKNLEEKLKSSQDKNSDLKVQLEDAKKSLKDCEDAIAQMIGASNAEIEAFKQKLGVLEGKVRDMKRLNDDQLADKTDEIKGLENELNELRANKISILPDIFPRVVTLAKDIKGLYREKKIKGYTVGTWAENRDCLWNIAGKIEIYGDPMLWPKIWQANKEIIRNPDIIHPGQVLTLPEKAPKNDDEMKAERKYWRLKRAASETNTTAPAPAGN
ncbi:MAG: hypothetical protein ACOVNU_07850 [Candidatus Kapaibacteriota bacterium]|jgi:hypothetical protein